ncbi:MAG: SDR family NAD(P)-dependent oxidoreductase [Rhodospirillales bacterium]|nr:SDR family NAD(P)-dependent oxidoreductase [Rhodospirillales bacterium]
MTILVTGAAGFIGFHVCGALLARGERVLGVDNVNDYYDVSLKQARLALLEPHESFDFVRADIADREAMAAAIERESGSITRIVHLAAQAGVRHSLIDPYTYVQANVMGQVVILELCRTLPALEHIVYASSSSVYGGVAEAPFSVDARADTPISLYAATKKAGELIGHVYGHLFAVPATGLRFFTVYGPWGRPDMAAFLFTRAILEGRPITLFNHGRMKRDFTYIGDVVPAVLSVLDAPPVGEGGVPHRLYNVGNNRPEALTDFVAALELALGRKAAIDYAPMQPGDVEETWADISALQRDHGYAPKTAIAEGIPRFVAWYREHYGV